MWELKVQPKQIISPEDTIDLDNRRLFETTRELWHALQEYGVPKNLWYVSGTTRHEHFGGRLVWERLAHRVPPMYGELHNVPPMEGQAYAA